jgi:hypothetical protein
LFKFRIKVLRTKRKPNSPPSWAIDPYTMQLNVIVNDARLTALLDSSSTHNFVDTEVAARTGIKLVGCAGLQVIVANGDRVASPGCCRGLKITMGEESFYIDCYDLSLDSYDMVLGLQWLESLGPILWDFGRRTMTLIWEGRDVYWSALDSGILQPVLHGTSIDMMKDLLQQFETVFMEPQGLPPPHNRCHQIRLQAGTESMDVRPYRYTHVQKAELERQCAEMLAHGAIHPCSSTFSAPVLLIKKSDNSWCFYVNYIAVNAKTIKDKFPIPVVEERLDELRATAFFSKLGLRSGYHQVLMHGDDIEKTTF